MTTDEMPAVMRETKSVHSRLIKCALAIEESRSFWERVDADSLPTTRQAFEEYWFGARSLSWVKEILAALRARYGAFPEALRVLHRWRGMPPETRAVISHWHTQVSDPLYRAFTGDFLPARRDAARPELHRATVVAWIGEHGNPRWTLATRKQLATRLLSAALLAGLVTGRRDPRGLAYPRVDDHALTYMLYFLRGIEFAGSLHANRYLRSVGLGGAALDARLSTLAAIDVRRSGDVVVFEWRYPTLAAWADAEVACCGVTP